jgi:hypothetical protein
MLFQSTTAAQIQVCTSFTNMFYPCNATFYFINTDIGCATNVMLNQTQTECLREDRRNGSCMVIEETNDNAVVIDII